MEDAVSIKTALLTKIILLNVHVNSGSSILGMNLIYDVLVSIESHLLARLIRLYSGICTLNNGGCGENALCSINKNGTARCECMQGFSNADQGNGMNCLGMYSDRYITFF